MVIDSKEVMIIDNKVATTADNLEASMIDNSQFTRTGRRMGMVTDIKDNKEGGDTIVEDKEAETIIEVAMIGGHKEAVGSIIEILIITIKRKIGRLAIIKI